MEKKTASPELEQYFKSIDEEVMSSYKLAEEARKKGLDPEEIVSIPLAKNMAERVVGLISVEAPEILGTKIPSRIIELEKEYGLLDWRVGFRIAEEVAKEKYCKFEDKKKAIETGIRVGFAYLTLGIVSAPLEGFIGLKIKKRKDGKEYFALQYAGPIRAAGGTASSVSVILSDYVRVKMGYHTYDPDEKEVSRYISEVHDYHERVTNLQYHPSDEELRFMVSHLPVEVDGDPTERMEVSNFKDLPRIETNLIRGGVALVLAEGLTQKTPKLWKRLTKWGKEMDLEHWNFLGDFLKLKDKIHSLDDNNKKKVKKDQIEDEDKKIKKKERLFAQANNTFIMDLVAGRPIFTHPITPGGFRLRYGRNRTSGFSASAINPATMRIVNEFIAIGTQLKTERPGKATTTTVCDTLEGPIVKLTDESVLQLNNQKEVKDKFKEVKEIIFLGDLLFNYGDFSENGQTLAPPGYCPEWWALEVTKSVLNYDFESDIIKGNIYPEPDFEDFKSVHNLISEETLLKIEQKVLTGITKERFAKLINHPLFYKPNLEEVLTISKKLNVPIHPDYTFYWRLISAENVFELRKWFQEGTIKNEEQKNNLFKKIEKIILPLDQKNLAHQNTKKILEQLGVTHSVINKENVVLAKKEANIFSFCFGFTNQQEMEEINNFPRYTNQIDGLDYLETVSPFQIRDKAGTFIGARMGRPEKGKMRLMNGSPQVMFPVSEEGGRMRSFQAALGVGKIRSTFPTFYCDHCQEQNGNNKSSIYPFCEECSKKCKVKYYCRFCGDLDKETCRHGPTKPYKNQDIDIKHYFNLAKKRLGTEIHPDLIKGVRGTSNKTHVVEHLVKGILRAKHGIYVNKDGTTRYDATELPITHFKPKEVHTSVERLRKLGYTHDIEGYELENDNQILEILPQDIILPGYDSLNESAPKVLSKVCNFIDDLLVNFYQLKPFYNLQTKEDLVGHLIIGLAPHISAGLIGRIIGYSETQGMITHPMYHAGLRRDCDGDEAGIMLLMDALLNFTRKYLPERRGAKTMDAPLVLTSRLFPSEVDDQVHGMEVMWKYPLEFYEAAAEMKKPWEVQFGSKNKKMIQLADRLETPAQYHNFGYTHHVDNFNKGVLCSAYKSLPTMKDKLTSQMDIAKKVWAVDTGDVAKLVIQKHFLKDIKGNFRKYSMQQFRCVKCNTKYRRPPMTGKCKECGHKGKLIFTISEGSAVKYLEPSLELARNYEFSPYLKQTLNLLSFNIEKLFGKEKEKQVGLGEFF